MYSKCKHILLILIIHCISNQVFSQFKGGVANGGDCQYINQTTCTAPENTNIYFGGNANGTGIAIITATFCSTPDNLNIYFGGIANGASTLVLIQGACSAPENFNISFGGNGGQFSEYLTSCTPSEVIAIYFGGNENGSSSSNLINCPSANPVEIFYGGNADGFAQKQLLQATCSVSENYNVFFGGNADGYENNYLSQTACTPPEALNLFCGGNADGFFSLNFTQVVCSTPENSNIFFGGNADGYSNKYFTQSVCPTPENTNIFIGGNADGYNYNALTQNVCATPENTNLFFGGNADGYSNSYFIQSVCSTPENTNIFIGGNADGYFTQNLFQQICTPAENTNIFTGGIADGFALQLLAQTTCSAPENLNVFLGGIANGESFQNLISCTPPELVNIYFGGNANGASSGNIVNCPVSGAATIYYGGNANGSSSSTIIQTTCPIPQNLNVYFGGNANGASIQNFSQTACPIPENSNIYFGGNSNGASIQIISQTICSPPLNTNIYFGGNANGASNNLVLQSSCPTPANMNIFFGGIADGYATRALIQPYYWTGAIDHSWHNPGNWSSSIVPDISALAIITDVPNYPIISISPAVSKSIILQLGSMLNVNNQNLTVAYDINNDGTFSIIGNPVVSIGGNLKGDYGTFISGNSRVIFNGSAGIQTIYTNSGNFYDVEINTAPLVTCRLTETFIVRHNLKITSGNLDALGYDVFLGGNWENAGVFISGSSSVIFNGTNQSITNPLNEIYYNLVITNNTQINLVNGVTVSNNLNFIAGSIITSTNLLAVGSGIGSPGSITYSSGRVIGKLERWVTSNSTYSFPVGTAGNMETLTLDVNGGLNPGSVIVEFLSSNPGNNGLPLSESGISIEKTFTEGYWSLTAANGLSANDYSITLEANGFTSNYFNNDARAIKRDNSGLWFLDGVHTDASNPYCYRDNLTGGISTLGTHFAIGTSDCKGGQIDDNYDICSNDDVPAFIDVTAPNGGSNNFSFTWQYTTNMSAIPGDSNWTDIAPSNTPDYDYGNLTASTRFVRKATATGCAGPVYSNIVNVTVYPLPTSGLSVLAGNEVVCNGDPAQLNITFSASTASYTIYLQEDGVEIDQFDQIEAPSSPHSINVYPVWVGPALPKTYQYTVIVTDSRGCSSVPVTPVDIDVYPMPETGPNYHITNSFGL